MGRRLAKRSKHHHTGQELDFVWLTQQMQKWDDINLDSDEIRGISENCVL